MKLTGIRKKVFLDRYAVKDKKGKPIETKPEQMWRRVAKGIAAVEKNPLARRKWSREFYKIMEGFKYVPGGRVLAGAGTGYDTTFFNCYVLPSPPDSRQGILDNLGKMVEIMAHGGGVGINLSSLRPRGARVKKVNGTSSGVVNWSELYSVATKDIIQQGGSRRGALMLMLWDWHPDIEEFISIKRDLTRINGANLSVCVSDRFMRAVGNDEDWPLIFPDLDDPDYDSVWEGYIEDWVGKGRKVDVYKTIKARDLWDKIAEAAWNSAEPGVVFMERYNKWYNNYYFNRINCVNPCGEQGLPAYGVCNLGSINLSVFVDKKGKFDYKMLEDHVEVAVRFQDNVIDGDVYIFDEIRKNQQEGERRMGLGTMGLGDALIKMGIRYGSDKSIEVIEKVYKLIRDTAYNTSVSLAREKGAFPKFDKEKYLDAYFIRQLPEKIRKRIRKYGIRNSLLLTQAPTGSTALMSQASSGIEPIFEFSFTRRDRLGKHKIFHPLYEEWKKANPDKAVPDYFVSARDLSPLEHVRVQAAIQKYVDSSISKTVNAPETFTVGDVKELYTKAYELGCKGITFMREGSRPGVLERGDRVPATNGKANGEIDMEQKETPPTEDIPSVVIRPLVLQGSTYRMKTPVGKSFITVNTDPGGNPMEVFITVGKSGSDVASMAEAIGRLVSLVFRMASPVSGKERVKSILYQLSDIGGSKSTGFGKDKVRSLPDALAKVLGAHFGVSIGNGKWKVESGKLKDKKEKEEEPITPPPTQLMLTASAAHLDICPECGDVSFAHEEGCKKCYSCGYSEC
jgi:ribonucleoside-diphosphate reductase alpha chain